MSNLIGQTLLNQYRVDSFVASGGMGAVYRVFDLKRNTTLAMKVLHADLADDPTVFKRFQREARALQQLRHPNVVSFYGLFQEKGQSFLLEEFIEGNSLQGILRERDGQPLPVNEVIIYMKGLCAALSYAHTNNIVHCDVKPGNVMVNHQGKIFLTDFGIARFVGATTTTTLGIAGTPSYMAPEQIVGRGISPVTDIYALGVMLFEMLTGQRPFRGTEPETEAGGDTPSERIRYGHLRVPPPDPQRINPNLSPALSQMILRGLIKNPADRFRSAQDFFLALCQAAQTQPNQVSDETTIIGEFIPAPLPPVAIQRVSNKPSSEPRLQPKQQKSSSSQRQVLAILAMGATLILAITIWGFGTGLIPKFFPTPVTEAPAIEEPAIEAPAATEASVVATEAPTTEVPATEVPSVGIVSTMVSPKDGMTMVFVPEGEFTMGSDNGGADEKPVHLVYLDAYWIDQTEVTSAMYEKCVDAGQCDTLDGNCLSCNSGYAKHPVINVDWYQANAYCSWVERRLPTEAEWEKAARGTDARTYPWGEGIDCNIANYYSSCVGDTSPVGSYESGKSPYGAYDMAGNVWEWVSSLYKPYPYNASDGREDMNSSDARVLRGGAWYLNDVNVRSANRDRYNPTNISNYDYGFRCARSLP